MSKVKKRVYEIIQIGKCTDVVSRLFDIFIAVVIILNISVLFLETFNYFDKYRDILHAIESITIIIFCIEYILRMWTADELYPKYSRGKAIIKFITSFDGVVDLLTILPFFFLKGFVALRMLRVVRIFHLFRINAYYDSFNVITSVIKEKRNQLISSVFIIFVLMMCSSLCMYSAENSAQPDVFDNAFSGIWWSISTILTVGYGDIYPITAFGRIMAIIIALLGVGAVAIPTGIISAGFVERYTVMQETKDITVPATVSAEVEKNSPFIGMTIKQLKMQYDMNVILVIRNSDVMFPSEKHTMKIGDKIVYQTNNLFAMKV